MFAVVALVSVLLAPAAAADPVQQAATALSGAPGVYLAPTAAGHPLTTKDAATLRGDVRSAGTPVYVAVLGETTPAQARADLRELIDRVHRPGTYVVVGQPGYVAGSDVPGVEGATDSFVAQARQAHPKQPLPELREFVRLVSAAASSAAPASGQGSGQGDTGQPGSSGSGTPSWVPLLIGLGIVAALVGFVRSRARRGSRADAAAFAEVRQAADQDVTRLGEELQGLDVPPRGADEATSDYRAALDAYDRAKAALGAARHPDDLRSVTLALEEGRWRLACVRARLAGRPIPERRPPCFFNPQHGPSTTDVQWAPPGGAPRVVPVCAADADRLARGQAPDERLVAVGGGAVPYWQAPFYYRPYASGFFGGWGGGSFLGGLLLGEMLGGPGFGGWGGYDAGAYDSGYDAGYDQGYGAGQGGGDFAGGFDTGGGDWSGGGGGDWGSGGGDWGGGGGDSGGGW